MLKIKWTANPLFHLLEWAIKERKRQKKKNKNKNKNKLNYFILNLKN
jgi:hypothetical protein